MAPFSSKFSQDLESKASIFLVREPTPSSSEEPPAFLRDAIDVQGGCNDNRCATIQKEIPNLRGRESAGLHRRSQRDRRDLEAEFGFGSRRSSSNCEHVDRRQQLHHVRE